MDTEKNDEITADADAVRERGQGFKQVWDLPVGNVYNLLPPSRLRLVS